MKVPRLRTATGEKAALLAGIGFAAWEHGRLGLLDAGRTDRMALRANFLTLCRDLPEAIIVAENDGMPVGWGAREDRDDYISDLWVDPDSQGRGVGAALLHRLETDIAEAGFGKARLNTLTGNTDALRFYQRHGYVILDEVHEFSASLGYEIDKFRLVKTLAAQEAESDEHR